MIKSDAFHLHLNALVKDQQSFKPLYIFSGDEPLLMMEAIDALRALARTGGFTEREVLVQDRYFDWTAQISRNFVSGVGARAAMEPAMSHGTAVLPLGWREKTHGRKTEASANPM